MHFVSQNKAVYSSRYKVQRLVDTAFKNLRGDRYTLNVCELQMMHLAIDDAEEEVKCTNNSKAIAHYKHRKNEAIKMLQVRSFCLLPV